MLRKRSRSSRNAGASKPRLARPAASSAITYFRYFLAAIGGATAWSLIGLAISWWQAEFWTFVTEWKATQGFFLVAIGLWLVLIARSGDLEERTARVVKSGESPPRGISPRVLRYLIVCTVAVAGTASLIAMGFNARGAVLGYMWVTCAAICGMAGFVTLHTVDLLVRIHQLQSKAVNIFHYAPARTPELRELINYFTSFTLILSLGYLFAFLGTWKAHWTGPKAYIEAVQLFWPVIYVPVCSVALFYPHFVLHKLIQTAKQGMLDNYQREMDSALMKYQEMKGEDVQRLNTLAQLFDRIAATPDYVFDIGIAVRAAIPYLVNLGIFIAKPAFGII
jgi:hypothetical protein